MKKIGVKTFPRAYDDLYLKDGEDREFYTRTGKIELYSTDLLANGQDAMPSFKPHEEPPAGFYRLIYGRNPDHTFGRTINNPNLNAIFNENVVWVNPKVAKEWGINNSQEVWLKNQDGIVSDFPVKVRITERIRWDSVYLVHGFGNTGKKLSRAFGKGASDSQLITRVHVDPAMGATGMRGNFITFLFEPEESTVNEETA
jgi:thiosulfate reductase/polysulfide reductase chain A